MHSKPGSASTSSRSGATSRHAASSSGATLNRLDISSRPVAGAVQYGVTAIFSTGEGHHAHDAHPGFEAWNAMADRFQTGDPLAFGGETIVELGIAVVPAGSDPA